MRMSSLILLLQPPGVGQVVFRSRYNGVEVPLNLQLQVKSLFKISVKLGAFCRRIIHRRRIYATKKQARDPG